MQRAGSTLRLLDGSSTASPPAALASSIRNHAATVSQQLLRLVFSSSTVPPCVAQGFSLQVF